MLLRRLSYCSAMVLIDELILEIIGDAVSDEHHRSGSPTINQKKEKLCFARYRRGLSAQA